MSRKVILGHRGLLSHVAAHWTTMNLFDTLERPDRASTRVYSDGE